MRIKLLFLSLCLCHTAQCVGPAWQLVWSDEFNDSQIDFTNWAIEENGHGGGNNELQYYLDTERNVRVEEGKLIIEAHHETVNKAGTIRHYTSARIRTKRRASWCYGRIEIRARLPKGQGLWPALWMLPETESYGGWAASGEIDIVEAKGHETQQVTGSLHYGGEWPHNLHQSGHYQLSSGDFSQAFHVFSIEWEANEIRWYVDGEQYQTINKWHSANQAFPAPFDQPFHLIFNLAVGGNWPGPPNSSTPFPAKLEVDYVRIYQQTPDPLKTESLPFKN